MPMHDFCILPVHAGMLALGGIIAYNHKGSKVRVRLPLCHCATMSANTLPPIDTEATCSC